MPHYGFVLLASVHLPARPACMLSAGSAVDRQNIYGITLDAQCHRSTTPASCRTAARRIHTRFARWLHAGVACDAYFAPKHGQFPHIRDGQDNEMETTYLDGDFLASEYKHVLKVCTSLWPLCWQLAPVARCTYRCA
jgi:hypothetical protein